MVDGVKVALPEKVAPPTVKTLKAVNTSLFTVANPDRTALPTVREDIAV